MPTCDFERKKMAKSTGNNILPREILTGENTILKLSLR
jgi:hypothetical protein